MVERRLISLFSGAGGLDLGLEAAGFSHAVGVEMDAEATATVLANRGWQIIQKDVRDVQSSFLLAAADAREGDIDLLCGGPPCQPFSKSGFWYSGEARRLRDPRAATLGEYLRVLREVKPKAFLLENVPGLAFSEKDEGLVLLRETIDEINRENGTRYSLSAAQLNAVEFGVPQVRQRVFVVGHRDGEKFKFPPPTHARPARVDMANGGRIEPEPDLLLNRAATAWDAIGHLEDSADPSLAMRGKWAELLPTIPEGQNYLFHTDRGRGVPIFGWRRHFWSFLLKLAKDLPSWTLTARPGPAIGPFHWRNRRLSSAELCALQTFPPGFRVVGGLAAAQRQIGNAVPSALAEVLGLEIRRQFFGDLLTSQATLLPRPRSDCPPPAPTAEVNQPRYLRRLGEDTAHPGTGLGRGASTRRGSEVVTA